jgi:hypothetical protein
VTRFAALLRPEVECRPDSVAGIAKTALMTYSGSHWRSLHGPGSSLTTHPMGRATGSAQSLNKPGLSFGILDRWSSRWILLGPALPLRP